MSSRLSQEHFKNQGKFEFKNQVSKLSFKNKKSRIDKLKIQESRKDSIKISTKKFFKTLNST